jgi:hypothetical protein
MASTNSAETCSSLVENHSSDEPRPRERRSPLIWRLTAGHASSEKSPGSFVDGKVRKSSSDNDRSLSASDFPSHKPRDPCFARACRFESTAFNFGETTELLGFDVGPVRVAG